MMSRTRCVLGVTMVTTFWKGRYAWRYMCKTGVMFGVMTVGMFWKRGHAWGVDGEDVLKQGDFWMV